MSVRPEPKFSDRELLMDLFFLFDNSNLPIEVYDRLFRLVNAVTNLLGADLTKELVDRIWPRAIVELDNLEFTVWVDKQPPAVRAKIMNS